jgi:hypothetical protein
VGTRVCTRYRPSSEVFRAGGSGSSRNVVSGGGGEFPLLRVYAFADPKMAVAEFKAEGLIKTTGRIYVQDYVLFLRAEGGRIAFLREYFDPVRAAKALDTPIRGAEL